ncbi:hypothetical protein PJP06_29330, partial [Mycobacterium kansasii]
PPVRPPGDPGLPDISWFDSLLKLVTVVHWCAISILSKGVPMIGHGIPDRDERKSVVKGKCV